MLKARDSPPENKSKVAEEMASLEFSVLMNETTLDAFTEFIVTANEASYEDISNLTPDLT
jgi:hypothetical protein